MPDIREDDFQDPEETSESSKRASLLFVVLRFNDQLMLNSNSFIH